MMLFAAGFIAGMAFTFALSAIVAQALLSASAEEPTIEPANDDEPVHGAIR